MLEVCKYVFIACETKWRTVEEVDCFKYLGSKVALDGGCESVVAHRMNEGIKHGQR